MEMDKMKIAEKIQHNHLELDKKVRRRRRQRRKHSKGPHKDVNHDLEELANNKIIQADTIDHETSSTKVNDDHICRQDEIKLKNDSSWLFTNPPDIIKVEHEPLGLMNEQTFNEDHVVISQEHLNNKPTQDSKADGIIGKAGVKRNHTHSRDWQAMSAQNLSTALRKQQIQLEINKEVGELTIPSKRPCRRKQRQLENISHESEVIKQKKIAKKNQHNHLELDKKVRRRRRGRRKHSKGPHKDVNHDLEELANNKIIQADTIDHETSSTKVNDDHICRQDEFKLKNDSSWLFTNPPDIINIEHEPLGLMNEQTFNEDHVVISQEHLNNKPKKVRRRRRQRRKHSKGPHKDVNEEEDETWFNDLIKLLPNYIEQQKVVEHDLEELANNKIIQADTINKETSLTKLNDANICPQDEIKQEDDSFWFFSDQPDIIKVEHEPLGLINEQTFNEDEVGMSQEDSIEWKFAFNNQQHIIDPENNLSELMNGHKHLGNITTKDSCLEA